MQQFHGLVRDQRRLFGRFGQNRVARSKGGGHLTRKDGQREVPRADTGEQARGRVRRGVGAIVAQEIHGFAQFCDRIKKGFAGLACEQGK